MCSIAFLLKLTNNFRFLMTDLRHTVIPSYLIIYTKVLLEPGKNGPQNCKEGFVLLLEYKIHFCVSIKQELLNSVEGAVISGSAKDFNDTNLEPDYLLLLRIHDPNRHGLGSVHHLHVLLWPCRISFSVVLGENSSNLHACWWLQRKKHQCCFPLFLPCLVSILNVLFCCCSMDSLK